MKVTCIPRRFLGTFLCVLCLIPLAAPPAQATPIQASPDDTTQYRLEDEIGRSEVRILSAPFVIEPGGTVWDYALGERLDRLGYQRTRKKPDSVGQYFWGNDVFWIHRRAFEHNGNKISSALLRLDLAEGGRISTVILADGTPTSRRNARLEPEVLAESLKGDRARRRPFQLDAVPKHVWQPVLAAEDARFFDHMGVDARSLARALLANVKAGKVTQGGSTITQQLIKNRDLTPRRSLRRKASEAMRALALEAEYDKKDILQTYLNQVYLGHRDGLAIHGLGAGARAYFNRPLEELSLAQTALLAAIIQGPNRLSPTRHPDAVKNRRDWVLGRMEELGWASAEDVARAKASSLGVRQGPLDAPLASHFRTWIQARAEDETPRRLAKGKGLRLETSLDPWAQAQAEDVVRDHLRTLRRGDDNINMALVALDAQTGDVVAYVGGHPDERTGGFDRARKARRQPGSAIKPLLLLEAFEGCGLRTPLYPASRVADEALRIDLPSGPWEPRNSDGRFHGTVTLRQALTDSLNIPFVRVSRWCGFEATAKHLRQAGLDIPKPVPPSMALGSVETSPLELATAYTAVAGGGRRVHPRPLTRIETPRGRRLAKGRIQARSVVDADSAYLVHDLMRSVVEDGGTARSVQLDGWQVAAKTGTTSERRDAWLAGYGNGLVTVVWVGRDDGKPLGLTGSRAAAPPWKAFMERTLGRRARSTMPRPANIVELYVDRRTGLLVGSSNRHGELELFREDAKPRRKRFWRRDPAVPVIR